MAKAPKQEEEDAPVDLYGRPLPLVRLVKGDVQLDVREAGSLSNLHYGQGFDFVEEGLTYHQALAQLLGEDVAHQVVVEVPPEGGDVVWPHPGEDDEAAEGGDEESGTKSGGRRGKKSD